MDARVQPKGEDLDGFDDGSELEELVGYALKRAYVVFLNDFRATLGEDGLSPRSFSALSLAHQFPGITQSELARRLGIERSGLVAIVDDLERRGFLTRGTVPGDRRVQALRATPAGAAAYADALGAVRAHETRMLGALSAGEKRCLFHLLDKIRAGAPA